MTTRPTHDDRRRRLVALLAKGAIAHLAQSRPATTDEQGATTPPSPDDHEVITNNEVAKPS